MTFAIWAGVSESPSPAGISETLRMMLMLARWRRTVCSVPPVTLKVMLVGESEVVMPMSVSPRCVFAIVVS